MDDNNDEIPISPGDTPPEQEKVTPPSPPYIHISFGPNGYLLDIDERLNPIIIAGSAWLLTEYATSKLIAQAEAEIANAEATAPTLFVPQDHLKPARKRRN